MAITSADYMLTDVWDIGVGQYAYNVYYVRNVSGTQSALDCINAFDASLAVLLQDIMAAGTHQYKTECFNLVDPTDFDTQAGIRSGLMGGEPMPTFVAVNYPILRASRDFRNSAKRYGRLSENAIVGNGISAIEKPAFDAVQTALMSQWQAGTGNWELMMPKRTKINGKYVLTDLDRPAGIGDYKVSTQNTRKS